MVELIDSKKELYDEIHKYISDPDSLALIDKAYDFAYEKHKDQKRKSGQPYFVHIILHEYWHQYWFRFLVLALTLYIHSFHFVNIVRNVQHGFQNPRISSPKYFQP